MVNLTVQEYNVKVLVGRGSSSDVRWTGISRYLPIVPRIPLDWDNKIKAKTDDANLERDEEHLGRFLKQSTGISDCGILLYLMICSVVTKSGAWEGWSKKGTGWTGKSWGGRHASFPVLPDGSKNYVMSCDLHEISDGRRVKAV